MLARTTCREFAFSPIITYLPVICREGSRPLLAVLRQPPISSAGWGHPALHRNFIAIPPPASLSYKCARAARTPHLLSIICPAGALSSPMVHPSTASREIATKKQPYVFRKAVPWCIMWERTRTPLCIRAVSAFLHPNGTCLVQ